MGDFIYEKTSDHNRKNSSTSLSYDDHYLLILEIFREFCHLEDRIDYFPTTVPSFNQLYLNI